MEDKKIGYLEYLRRKKGLTQVEFAQLLGLGQGTISKMEKFLLPITVHVLKELRDKFKLNVNKSLDQGWFEKKDWTFERKGNHGRNKGLQRSKVSKKEEVNGISSESGLEGREGVSVQAVPESLLETKQEGEQSERSPEIGS